MNKFEVIKNWYPKDALSDDEAKVIYDNLLRFYMTLYKAKKEINNSNKKGKK